MFAFILLLNIGIVLAKPFSKSTYIQYSTVTGYFAQDDPTTVASTFDYTTSNFGLLNRTYTSDSLLPANTSIKTQWARFAHEVARLNLQANSSTSYKVLHMGRHGEGYHNAAETFYGTPAWNCYWSELNGNDTVTWDDARLTQNGVSQALRANAFWSTQLATAKTPAPESYYTSPLYRCLSTASLTFNGLDLPATAPFVPTIKELLRESISIHTCDRRSNATTIANAFPSYLFETGFQENDLLWRGTTGESSTAQTVRSKTVLDDLFTSDQSTYISITSHSGEIASILGVLGHRTFALSTGAAIPVLVRAVELEGDVPTTTVDTWTGLSTCTALPVLSSGTAGCVCGGTSTSSGATATATS